MTEFWIVIYVMALAVIIALYARRQRRIHSRDLSVLEDTIASGMTELCLVRVRRQLPLT